MKRAIALCVVLAACGSKGKPTDRHPMRGTDRVPSVSTAEVLAADVIATPPLLVIVDANGIFFLGAADTWDSLATADPLADARSGRAEHVGDAVKEAFTSKRPPREVVDEFGDNERAPGGDGIVSVRPRDPDPETPPPEEEKPDDGAEESGGTSMLVNLDEAALRNNDAKASMFASLEAIAAHQRGATGYQPRWQHWVERLALVSGEVALGGHVTARQPALVLAAPTAPARALISAVAATEGLIAVNHQGRVRPLRLEFLGTRGEEIVFEPDWIEVRVGVHDVALELPPGAPIVLPDARPETLAAALRDLRAAANRYADTSPIDVLVDRTASAQRLVDVLVALDLAGERSISLGEAPEPDSVQASLRGHHEPTLKFGQPSAQGDLPKPMIRKTVRRHSHELLTCFKSRLLDIPWPQGTIQTQFFISPDGTVATAAASGVHPAVAECFAAVIKTIEFPKPQGGGGVQVNYPFTLRP